MKTRMLIVLALLVLLIQPTGLSAQDATDAATQGDGPGFDAAAMAGNWSVVFAAGPDSIAGVGNCTMERDSHYACTATASIPTGDGERMRIMVEEYGTFTLNADGTAAVEAHRPTPDGSEATFHYDCVVTETAQVASGMRPDALTCVQQEATDASGVVSTSTLYRLMDAETMTAAGNKELYRRLVEEVFNQKNVDALDDLVGEDFVDHNPLPGQEPGLEGVKAALSSFLAAFPDAEFHIESLVAEGDLVVARGTMRGTHEGEIMGIPPTGEVVTMPYFDMGRVEDGKFVERWGLDDSLALLTQLGVIPPMAGETDEEATSAAVNEVTFIGTDYAFAGPDSIPAGWTRIRLENQGAELHHAQLLKLPEGKTMDDLIQALQQDPSHPPHWLSYDGGPSVVIPGDSTAVTLDLAPGNYVLICVMPDAEGVPHAALGMMRPLTVTETDGDTGQAPDADLTMEMFDYNFALSAPVTAGKHTIKVVNNGPQPHEVAVVQLAPGATPQEFLASVEPGAEGPPLGKPIGGLQVIDSGAEGYFTAEFEAGNDYLLICFHPDEEDGAPHFAHGMLQVISVDE